MTDLEELWRSRTDEQLLEAFSALEEYSEQGQRVIHAEFVRRGLAEPTKKPITFQDALAVRTLHRRFIGSVCAQWLSLIFLVFLGSYFPRSVDAALGLLCVGVFVITWVLVPATGYKLMKQLEVESPGPLAILMCAPLFSLLVLIGIRSFTARWSKEHGVAVDFLGPTKQDLARLGGGDAI
jgi:hypothetical protein